MKPSSPVVLARRQLRRSTTQPRLCAPYTCSSAERRQERKTPRVAAARIAILAATVIIAAAACGGDPVLDSYRADFESDQERCDKLMSDVGTDDKSVPLFAVKGCAAAFESAYRYFSSDRAREAQSYDDFTRWRGRAAIQAQWWRIRADRCEERANDRPSYDLARNRCRLD